VNITASVIATNIALQIFPKNPLAYATGIITFVILVFGEILPKNFAASNYEKWLWQQALLYIT